MTSLRVAILCSADSYRGSAVSFLHLAQGLDERGATVRLYSGHGSVTEPLRNYGVDIVQLDLRSTNLRTTLRLRAELKTFAADVLMVDRPRDLRLGFLATAGTRVPLINRYNSHAPRPPSDVLIRMAYRWKVAETVFLTQEKARQILPLAPWIQRRPHRVIAEGISVGEFRPDAAGAAAFRAKHALGDTRFVLSVGAFTREKRTELLIEAMHRLPNAPLLVLCGEGPLGDSLRTRADDLGVRTIFIERMPRVDLRGAYCAASVFAHACPVETFGLSVLEAMACGAPVVGVRAGGLLEVIGETGEAGLLVPPEDADAMARLIGTVLGDPALAARLRVGARARAESRFTLDAMADGYERLLREACVAKR